MGKRPVFVHSPAKNPSELIIYLIWKQTVTLLKVKWVDGVNLNTEHQKGFCGQKILIYYNNGVSCENVMKCTKCLKKEVDDMRTCPPFFPEPAFPSPKYSFRNIKNKQIFKPWPNPCCLTNNEKKMWIGKGNKGLLISCNQSIRIILIVITISSSRPITSTIFCRYISSALPLFILLHIDVLPLDGLVFQTLYLDGHS